MPKYMPHRTPMTENLPECFSHVTEPWRKYFMALETAEASGQRVYVITHAQRVSATYYPWKFENGTIAWEKDRKAGYIVQDASGTVNVVTALGVTTVTWVKGDRFNAGWNANPPRAININGKDYSVASIGTTASYDDEALAETLTVTDGPATVSSVSFLVRGGKWQGIYVGLPYLLTITDGASPIPLDLTFTNWYDITLSDSATGAAPTGAAPGKIYFFRIKQDSSGGFTWTWPAAFVGGQDISPDPDAEMMQAFWYDGTTYEAIGGGGGSPGGNTTDVQVNIDGEFYGDDGFTYNPATNIVRVDENIDFFVGDADEAVGFYVNSDGSNPTAYLRSAEGEGVPTLEVIAYWGDPSTGLGKTTLNGNTLDVRAYDAGNAGALGSSVSVWTDNQAATSANVAALVIKADAHYGTNKSATAITATATPSGTGRGIALEAHGDITLTQSDLLVSTVRNFSGLPTASSTYKGAVACVGDSTTAVWGATITGGGANVVMAFCNGTNWTVMGK